MRTAPSLVIEGRLAFASDLVQPGLHFLRGLLHVFVEFGNPAFAQRFGLRPVSLLNPVERLLDCPVYRLTGRGFHRIAHVLAGALRHIGDEAAVAACRRVGARVRSIRSPIAVFPHSLPVRPIQ